MYQVQRCAVMSRPAKIEFLRTKIIYRFSNLLPLFVAQTNFYPLCTDFGKSVVSTRVCRNLVQLRRVCDSSASITRLRGPSRLIIDRVGRNDDLANHSSKELSILHLLTMLRRKPTRQELDQTDTDELDQIRKEWREKAEVDAMRDAPAVVTEKTAREKAIEGSTVRDRLGLPRRMQSQ